MIMQTKILHIIKEVEKAKTAGSGPNSSLKMTTETKDDKTGAVTTEECT